MALISKGIKLYAKDPNGFTYGGQEQDPIYGTELLGLQEVGELAGIGAGSTRDKIEVTTLADDKHVYVEGIQAESEASAISFKFLFEDKLFTFLKRISANETAVRGGEEGELTTYFVRIPVGAKYHDFQFKGYISDLKVDSASVNSAITMSMSLTPAEAITFTAASAE
jgi:hypothetical protein